MQKTIVRITLLLIVLADTGMQPNGHARACLHACGVGGREVCGRGEVAGFLPRFFGVRLSDGVAYMIFAGHADNRSSIISRLGSRC